MIGFLLSCHEGGDMGADDVITDAGNNLRQMEGNV